MRTTSTHLFSVRLFLIAAAFGCAAMLVIAGSLHVQIPGTNVVTDPREVFVIIGSALTGPVGGALIGTLAGLVHPNPDLRLFVIVLHIVNGVWIGWSYKRLVHDRMHMPVLLLGWAGIVTVYYFVCAIPVVALTKYLYPSPQASTNTFMLSLLLELSLKLLLMLLA